MLLRLLGKIYCFDDGSVSKISILNTYLGVKKGIENLFNA